MTLPGQASGLGNIGFAGYSEEEILIAVTAIFQTAIGHQHFSQSKTTDSALGRTQILIGGSTTQRSDGFSQLWTGAVPGRRDERLNIADATDGSQNKQHGQHYAHYRKRACNAAHTGISLLPEIQTQTKGCKKQKGGSGKQEHPAEFTRRTAALEKHCMNPDSQPGS